MSQTSTNAARVRVRGGGTTATRECARDGTCGFAVRRRRAALLVQVLALFPARPNLDQFGSFQQIFGDCGSAIRGCPKWPPKSCRICGAPVTWSGSCNRDGSRKLFKPWLPFLKLASPPAKSRAKPRARQNERGKAVMGAVKRHFCTAKLLSGCLRNTAMGLVYGATRDRRQEARNHVLVDTILRRGALRRGVHRHARHCNPFITQCTPDGARRPVPADRP